MTSLITLFNSLNVQFPSNSFIQRCPSITLRRNNVFSQFFHKVFFFALRSFSLAWLGHVKILKVNLALFVSGILLKSHRQPCRHHSTLKCGQ